MEKIIIKSNADFSRLRWKRIDKNTILDLTNLDYINSEGLAIIHSMWYEKKFELVLHCREEVSDILELIGLSDVYKTKIID